MLLNNLLIITPWQELCIATSNKLSGDRLTGVETKLLVLQPTIYGVNGTQGTFLFLSYHQSDPSTLFNELLQFDTCVNRTQG